MYEAGDFVKIVADEEKGVVLAKAKDGGENQYRVVKLDKFSDPVWRYFQEIEPWHDPAPAIPPGWTPASEPPGIPNWDRTVHVKLSDGREWYAWCLHVFGGARWIVFNPGAIVKDIFDGCTGADWHDAAPGEVLCWREIEAEPEKSALDEARICMHNFEAWRYKEGEIHAITPSETLQAAIAYALIALAERGYNRDECGGDK